MSELEVLIPTSQEPPRQQGPLAPRLPSVQGRRIAVVRTMPPGSGIEELAARTRHTAGSAGAMPADLQRRDFLLDDAAERQEIRASQDAAVIVAGPSATVVEVSIRYAAELETAGIPTVVLFPPTYGETAHYAAARATAPVRILPAPELVGEMDADAPARALRALTIPLTETERTPDRTPAEPQSKPRTLRGRDRAELVAEFHERGWTDGLPVELPTETAVERMLSGTSLDADRLVTETFRPEARPVTVRDIAANAIMAGALPLHLPAVLAAASLMGRTVVDSMTRSVNSFAFAQYIGGPFAASAGVNGGLNALGPGSRANAAIGRCLNLMVRNLGGARTGVNSTPTQGNAACSFAFGENQEQSPWTPLQQDFGIKPSSSSLTLYGGGFCHFGNFYYGGLDDIVTALATPDLPSGALILVSAKRARHLAAEGHTREGLQEYLHHRVSKPLAELRESGFYPLRRAMTERGDRDASFGAWPPEYLAMSDDAVVPVYAPGAIHVAVVGSDSASLAQIWIMGRLGTACIDDYL